MFCCIYDTSEHNANARAFQWTWQTMIVYKKRTDTNTHHTVHMKRGAIKTKKSCTRHGDTFGKRKSGHAKRRVACTFCSWDVCGSSSFYVVFVPLLSSFLLFFFFRWNKSETTVRTAPGDCVSSGPSDFIRPFNYHWGKSAYLACAKLIYSTSQWIYSKSINRRRHVRAIPVHVTSTYVIV